MKIISKHLFILLFAILITSCANDFVVKEGDNSFKVRLTNISEPLSTAKNLVIYKSAKTTLENNFKYFVISEEHFFGLDSDSKDKTVNSYEIKISCFSHKPNDNSVIDASEYLKSHPKLD